MKNTFALVFASLLTCISNAGVINLSLYGPETVELNEQFNISLVASGNETMMAADVIIGWNPNDLQLIGVSHQNSHPLIWSSESGIKYPDFYGINESIVPMDGTALYTGYVQLGQSINASNSFQIASFNFKAINTFTNTTISILPDLEINYPCETAVYGSNAAGVNVTGNLGNIQIVPSPGVLSLLAIGGILVNKRRR